MSDLPVRKYVICCDKFGESVPVLFPESIQHDSFKILNPISAGFVTVFPPLVRVSPIGSDSLGIKPHAEDEAIIKKFLGL